MHGLSFATVVACAMAFNAEKHTDEDGTGSGVSVKEPLYFSCKRMAPNNKPDHAPLYRSKDLDVSTRALRQDIPTSYSAATKTTTRCLPPSSSSLSGIP